MGGITSSIGLISGIDSGSLIQQLLQIDARPKVLAQRRIAQLQQQQAAYIDINSSLLALKSAGGAFNTSKIFKSTSALSSNESALAATASTSATPGTYDFIVDRLVTSQRALSRGFTDRDTSGVGATTFTFERGGGGVTKETTLAELNGAAGVRRGKIKITDGSGASTTVDLSRSITVDDVLDAINSASNVSVTASITGDGLTITDTSGGGGNLVIANALGYQTATDLGIAGSSAGAIVGTQVRSISENTALKTLNDGLGVLVQDGATNILITARNGTAINVSFGEEKVEVLSNDETIDSIDYTAGTEVSTIPNFPTGEARPDTEFQVVETRATTLGHIIDRINRAAVDAGADVVASIDATNNRLVITDNTGSGGNLVIASVGTNANTAEALGIATTGFAGATLTGDRLVSEINSVLVRNLNGGAGLTDANLSVTTRDGNTTAVDISALDLQSVSLSEVLEAINTQLAGANVTVGLNRAGNGLSVTDSTVGGSNLTITGTLAEELGIDADVASSAVNGVNIQHKWLSRSTSIDALDGGRGVSDGEVRFTMRSGASVVLNIAGAYTNVHEFLNYLNSRPEVSGNLVFSINEQGDGISVEDISTGTGTFTITDTEGSVAASLNWEGDYEVDGTTGRSVALGSNEHIVTFDTTDTLDDVARKINLEGLGITASVINDGSSNSPYRLSFSSGHTGRSGRFIIDTQGFDLGLSTLDAGEDAVVFFGSSDPASAVLMTSASNTLDNVISGVTIDLKGTSAEPIEVSVQRDTDAIETAVQAFVDAFNTVTTKINDYDNYNADTEKRGTLLGDVTVSNIERSMFRLVQGRAQNVDGPYQYLFQVGIRIGSDAQLEFNRDDFRAAMENNFDNVADLLGAFELAPREPIELAPGVTIQPTEDTYVTLGVGEQFKNLVDQLTNSIDGLITRKDRALQDQIDLQNSRIESIDAQLARKQARYEAQFAAMEQTLALLTQQQSAIGSLSSLSLAG
ncbi:MAG: flagellar filament capping protein FliD [Phycisphaerales bacterium]|nr:flagellar filament capping protein FliD [Phycisphaerales bacterium]